MSLEQDAKRGPRSLRFESLECRRLLTRSGVVEFDFTEEFGFTTDDGVRVHGEASIVGELTYANSSDFKDLSLGATSFAASGSITDTVNGPSLSGSVDVNVVDADLIINGLSSGLITLDGAASGTFSAIVALPFPLPSPTITGTFDASVNGTLDLEQQLVSGDLTIELVSSGGLIDRTIELSVEDHPIHITPGDFRLPDHDMASLSGNVWLDADSDGERDEAEGEPDKSGILVELRKAVDDALVATAVTDQSGGYSFIDVDPNEYVLRFNGLPRGNRFTTPNAGPDDVDSDVVTNSDTATIIVELQNDTTLDAGIVAGSAFQNLLNRHDIDASGEFTLVDVFAGINAAISGGFGVDLPETRQAGELLRDVDGNGRFTLVDLADLVAQARVELFGEANDGGGAAGEGEGQTIGPADDVFARAWHWRQRLEDQMLDRLAELL